MIIIYLSWLFFLSLIIHSNNNNNNRPTSFPTCDSISWGNNGLVAYGAHNFIALLSPSIPKVLATLPGHKDRVNHVQWIPNCTRNTETKQFNNEENELVSVSSDHTIIIWKRNENNNNTLFSIKETLKGHSDSVTSCSIVRNDRDGSLLLCSTSTDNTVNIWKRDAGVDSVFALIQSIEFKPRMMTCSSLGFIPGTNTAILVLGGVESKIHLYVQDFRKEGTILFRKVVSLQGHQDWIRCLKFRYIPQTDELFLASSSQDNKIRLWKVSQKIDQPAKQQEQEDGEEDEGIDTNTLIDSLKSSSITGVKSLSSKGHIFNVSETETTKVKVIVLLESVMSGHEDWVYSVSWYPVNNKQDGTQEMCLVSSSMDKTMIVWRPDPKSGVWMDEVRIGDMGGNILGLYGAVFSPTGEYLLSHGYNGAFHLWGNENHNNNNSSRAVWRPEIITSGHFGPVQDLMWAPDYNYFISCSTDRTLRLYSQWDSSQNQDRVKGWFEIARPQIHGYDLECFTFIHGKNHAIVSGAEEKILRVFLGSQNFIDTLSNISGVVYEDDGQMRPAAANQPSLGLSNKPFFTTAQQDGTTDGQEMMIAATMAEDNEGLGEGGFEDPVPFNPAVLATPPFEEHLLQSSLWPEVQKLYGHGNEIIAVAASYDGKYIASTCRASSSDQATVRIWSVANWREVANLKGHQLTVVQLAFSHDNRYLLGVSRDRMWSLWRRTSDETNPYVRVAALPKSHGRIVWGCSWSYDDKLFATGSRDKIIKIWANQSESSSSSTVEQENWKAIATLPTFTSGVTAVEFAPDVDPENYILAVGEEEGHITIWSGPKTITSTDPWKKIHTIDSNQSHISDVRRIRWRLNKKQEDDKNNNNNNNSIQLVTCSTDNSVRLFKLNY
ncbi:WD-40 repeat-containing protein [Cavenderia fasciculata]|uniref:Elongator complex protein 2 n=1 Tax=Cavenderia fasciculata TaxID=261658 RepID=F4PVX6_CACFS|nr:WD-40 repeat-containing protein [Cavenderia fasciculata]EGG20140.1 WD-40 repeat-containing protein [Cavenderia fasciculata]|eukprot:XP_004367123.1 WD-40 repeat-containing protein [Cavenderia fasciculata]